jgi:hypothetical protein
MHVYEEEDARGERRGAVSLEEEDTCMYMRRRMQEERGAEDLRVSYDSNVRIELKVVKKT